MIFEDNTFIKKNALAGEPKRKGGPKKQIIIKETIILESQSKVKEVAILITEFSSKISKPALYNEVVNNLIHDKC